LRQKVEAHSGGAGAILWADAAVTPRTSKSQLITTVNLATKSLSAAGVLALGLLFTCSACSGDEPSTGGSGGSSGSGGATAAGPTQPGVHLGEISSTGAGPNDSGRQGLVLAKSEFGSVPLPATMVIMRPADEAGTTWTEEKVVTAPGLIYTQLGDAADGTIVVRQAAKIVDEDTDEVSYEIIGEASVLTVQDGSWNLESTAAADITWRENSEGDPVIKTYEMGGGNVFHKCMWWDPKYGEPGILTISANMPYMLIWRRDGGKWKPELLWSEFVGGKEQRYRDVEVGDVDHDGQDELVLVTHDRGAIYVMEQTENGLVAEEIHRTDERIFVHEAEIGDVDGDGKVEFFTTPSEPNRLDGHEQAGWVDMYRYNADTKKYDRTVVAELTDRHAKEILVADYEGDGSAELYIALEAEGTDKVVGISRYTWQDGKMTEEFTHDLKGKMCRFLNLADTDGDGVMEIIASTRNAGIFKMWKDPESGEWKDFKIKPFYVSSSFEHATVAFDWDGDGADDLFVAADDQEKIYRVTWNAEKKKYDHAKIGDWAGGGKYFVWGVMPLPAGQ
jgi:hypothetical protein